MRKPPPDESLDPRLYDRTGPFEWSGPRGNRVSKRYIWARLRNEIGRIKRIPTKLRNEQAAIEFANEWERKAANPAYRRAAEATLGAAISDWLADLQRRAVSAATYEIAETKLGHFVRVWGEAWPLIRIDGQLVLAFIATRERERAQPPTIKKELDELRRCLKLAKFVERFPRDLGTVFPPGYSARHKPRTRWLTPEEAVALIKQLDERRGAHVAFILATGSRRGESFRARRADVHLDADNPHVEVRGTKTKRARDTVAITGITYPLMVYALQHAPETQRGPLFDPWGKMVRDLKAACVRAGIERASANDLRRTFGKWHRLKGVSVEHVSVLLRHATDTLAQTTYAQMSGADIGPTVRGLVPILYPGTVPTPPIQPNASDDPAGKAASPTGFGPVTPGLGNLGSSSGASRRSVGNKLAHERRAANALVPILDASNPGAKPETVGTTASPALEVSFGSQAVVGRLPSCEEAPVSPPPPGSRPGLAKTADGAVGVRVEVDGLEFARTDARPGEPVADEEARLRLAVGQRGGLPR